MNNYIFVEPVGVVLTCLNFCFFLCLFVVFHPHAGKNLSSFFMIESVRVVFMSGGYSTASRKRYFLTSSFIDLTTIYIISEI